MLKALISNTIIILRLEHININSRSKEAVVLRNNLQVLIKQTLWPEHTHVKPTQGEWGLFRAQCFFEEVFCSATLVSMLWCSSGFFSSFFLM